MPRSLASGNLADSDVRQLLFDLMRSPETVDGERLSGLSDEQWDALVSLANRQRCASYLSYVIAKMPGIEQPAKLIRIRDRYTLKAMQIGRECAIMSSMLDEAGIRHIFLKGVALALRDYPEPWTRPMRDIDLLVDPDRLEEAHGLILAKGGTIDEYAFRPVERTEEGKHLPPIHSPNRVLPVEVHYRMILPTIALPRSACKAIEASAWDTPDSLPIGGANLPVPDTETMLAHLVVHAMFDHELNNGPQFLTDVIHLLRSNRLNRAKWDALVERAQLGRAVALTASLLPKSTRELLTVEGEERIELSNRVAISLMFQDIDRRSELKLHASLERANIWNRAATVFGKVFADRTTLTGRWLADGGELGKEPRSMIAFWAWSFARAIKRLVSGTNTENSRERSSLRVLRSKLGTQLDGE